MARSPRIRLMARTVSTDSRIGSRCEVGPYTIVEGSIVKNGARVGPFTRLRPGTVIEEDVHVGNFVEVKKSRIGRG